MFESCSAYQDSRPDILFLSHCVPNPPDKGEKIRAHYELKALCEGYRVHLACLARGEGEMEEARELSELCASVHAELFRPGRSLLKAAAKFAFGACLNEQYYNSRRLHSYVAELGRRVPIQAALVYTAVMLPYVPEGIPGLLDMVDVDSEKWFEYGRTRRPGAAYRLEGRRMRRFEAHCAKRSKATILATGNEASVLRDFVPGSSIGSIENGVDGDFFDGAPRPLPGWDARPMVVFVGTMDYQPNIEGAVRFAEEIFPALRRRVADLEFFIVGRNPAPRVKQLARRPGIRVTGAVPDVRPYLSQARAVVAPLAVARGIQNKVLEALAMGRRVLASEAVCRTFGQDLPLGLVACGSADRFVSEIERSAGIAPQFDLQIREAALERFSWRRNMERMAGEMALLCKTGTGHPSLVLTP